MKKKYPIKNVWIALLGLLWLSQPLTGWAQCIATAQWPLFTVTPATNGSLTTIDPGIWAGDFSVLNLQGGLTYQFTSSVATDFLTLTTATNTVIAFGTTSISSGVLPAGGIYRLHVHTNASCGTQSLSRTTTAQALLACPVPSGLNAGSVTTSAATLNWNSVATAQGYEVEFRADTTGAWTTQTTTATTLTLNGLLPSTLYQTRVRALCANNEQSSFTSTVNFITLCVPSAISTFPYTESFDAETVPALPCGWTFENLNNDAFTWATLAQTGLPQSPPNALAIRWNGTLAMDDWAYTPELILTAGTSYVVRFGYRAQSASFPERLKVHIGNSATVTAMTTLLGDLGSFNNVTYQLAEFIFTPTTTGSYFVGLHGYSIADQFRILVDNFEVDLAPDCPAPTALSASALTTTSATLSWNGIATAQSYVLEFREDTTGPWTVVPTTDTTAALTGLAPTTLYEARVQSICSASSESNFSATITFRTRPVNDLCADAITVTCGTSELAGTNLGATGTGGPTTSCGTVPGSFGVWYRFVGTGDEVTVNTCDSIGFDTKLNVYRGSCDSLICVGGNDDFCGLRSQVGFNSEVGTDYYIYVTGFGTARGNFVLNLSCVAPPTCAPPTALTSSAVTTSGATLNWTASATAESYVVEFRAGTSGDWTMDTTTATTLTLTGLASGTLHQARVRALCAAGLESSFSNTVSFTTLIPAPANDLCADAVTVTCGTSGLAGTSLGATGTGGPTGFCGTTPGSFGVWYRFLGTGDEVTVNTFGSTFDTQLNIYGGACDSLVCVGGNDDADNNTLQSEVVFNSEVGTDYYIYVTGFGTARGNFVLNVSCEAPLATGSWTGGQNSNFGNPANWVGGVPDATQDAVIPATAPNMPTLGAGQSFSVKSVTIEAGASFTLNGTLTVATSMANNGTMTTGNGSQLVFAGTAPGQTLGGNSALSLHDLSVINGAVLGLTRNLSLRGELLLDNGTLALGAQTLTMVSTASQTASIAPVTSGSLTRTSGQVVMQRFVGNQTRYFNLSTPMGTSGRSFDFPLFLSNNAANTLFWYDESVAGDRNQGWKTPGNITSGLPLGRGFIAYLTTPGTVSTSGMPLIGSLTLPLSFTASGGADEDGWHLPGNPYPSDVDWTALYNASATNLTPFAYVRRTGSNYEVIEANESGDPTLRSSESFFVKATGAATLNFAETVKAATGNRGPVAAPMARVELQLAAQDVLVDQTVIRFRAGSEADYEPMRDALKLGGGSATLSSIAQTGQWLAINSVGEMPAGQIVPLALTGAAGSYRLTAEALSSLPTTTEVLLIDLVSNTTVDLRQQPAVTLTHAGGTADTRWEVRFAETTTSLAKNQSLRVLAYPNPARSELRVSGWNGGEAADLTLFDALGRSVRRLSTAQGQVTLSVGDLPAGFYSLTVRTAAGTQTEKVVIER